MVSLFSQCADNCSPCTKSSDLRRKRFQRFLHELAVSSASTILDVGGDERTWIGTGLESKVTLLNIRFVATQTVFKYIEGDACDMGMIGGKSFDVVFSNSVIEHVGNIGRQKLFAEEIERVGKSYWVQTPYKHFPIEPHFLFPLFQYLPNKMKKFVGMSWKYSHLKRNNENILEELSRLRLLTIGEMKRLFPEAMLLKEKYCGLVKSIVVVKK